MENFPESGSQIDGGVKAEISPSHRDKKATLRPAEPIGVSWHLENSQFYVRHFCGSFGAITQRLECSRLVRKVMKLIVNDSIDTSRPRHGFRVFCRDHKTEYRKAIFSITRRAVLPIRTLPLRNVVIKLFGRFRIK
jgi:hypothetical protein